MKPKKQTLGDSPELKENSNPNRAAFNADKPNPKLKDDQAAR
jgi:hypothetical protein